MAKRTAPPSRVSGRGRDAAAVAAQPRVDVRGWLGGIRLSGFMMIMLGLVVLAAFVLVPSLGTYIDQQQRIAALEHSVTVTKDQVAALERERDRWSDPAYITTQARERLYYVKPGEVVYLVDDDLSAGSLAKDQKPVSDKVEAASADWMTQLVRSVTGAGLAGTAREALTIGVPDEPTLSPTPSG